MRRATSPSVCLSQNLKSNGTDPLFLLVVDKNVASVELIPRNWAGDEKLWDTVPEYGFRSHSVREAYLGKRAFQNAHGVHDCPISYYIP